MLSAQCTQDRLAGTLLPDPEAKLLSCSGAALPGRPLCGMGKGEGRAAALWEWCFWATLWLDQASGRSGGMNTHILPGLHLI